MFVIYILFLFIYTPLNSFLRSLQEGQDIFGVDFDYDEFEKYGEEDYESEEDEDLDEYMEDEEEDGGIYCDIEIFFRILIQNSILLATLMVLCIGVVEHFTNNC